MFSIKTKLIIAYTAVFGILIVGYSVYIYQQMYSAGIEALDSKIESFAERFEAELEEQLQKHSTVTRSDIVAAQNENINRYAVRVLLRNGVILFEDSLFSGVTVGQVALLEKHSDFLTIGRTIYRTATLPLEIDDVQPLIFQIASPMTEVEANLDSLRFIFFVTIPFAFLLAAVAAYAIITIGFRPMTRMIESAKKISERNLEEQLPIPAARDEVRVLGETFNTMLERIAAGFRSQKKFIADASHEIRTPLTIITAELEYALRSLQDEQAKNSIVVSLEEVDHLKRLTENLLMLATLDAEQNSLMLQDVRFDEVVLDSVRRIKHVAEAKNISFDVQIPSAVSWVCDEERMRVVLMILLDNAVKYSYERTVVRILLIASDGGIVLTIANRGLEIPAEDIPFIFDRFYRVASSRSDQSGSGLGLSIAYQIVDLHHGSIAVSSIPNGTTTFTIRIPVIE